MLISVIVPVYNVEKYISKCIDSILKQNYSNIELILVNDGSTDRSGKICDTYEIKDNRVKVIHKANGGQSSARNLGLTIANGEYIAFLDSDDFWLDNKLKDMVNLLEENNPDMLMFKAYSYYSNKNSYECFSKEYDKSCFNGSGKEVLSNILDKDYDFGWCPIWYLIKREIIIKNNLKFLDGYLCEDVNYTFKLWNCVNSVMYYNEYVYAYRRDNQSSTTHIASFKFCNDLLYMIDTNLSLFEKYHINDKLQNLLFLNMQTLISVVLFWLYKYDKDERYILIQKIEKIKKVYNIDREYSNLVCRKEKIILKLIKIFGINNVGLMWSLKSKFKKLIQN